MEISKLDSRNTSKVAYGQEHGKNLIKVLKKLAKNKELCMLMKNTDLDPLNLETHPKDKDFNGLTLINHLFKAVPFLDVEDQTTTTKVVVLFDQGVPNSTNPENENIRMVITIYCPFDSWLITGEDLRPLAIMAEIRKSLQGVRINGLGEIRYDGFDLATLTENLAAYNMDFQINAFN